MFVDTLFLLYFAFGSRWLINRVRSRHLPRLQEIYAQHSLSFPVRPTWLIDHWFAFRPQQDDPPALAADKQQLWKQIGKSINRFMLIHLIPLGAYMLYRFR